MIIEHTIYYKTRYIPFYLYISCKITKLRIYLSGSQSYIHYYYYQTVTDLPLDSLTHNLDRLMRFKYDDCLPAVANAFLFSNLISQPSMFLGTHTSNST
ncbi:hypothetical protein Hanom_Chr12g01152761 [Helianthus anomalus]